MLGADSPDKRRPRTRLSHHHRRLTFLTLRRGGLHFQRATAGRISARQSFEFLSPDRAMKKALCRGFPWLIMTGRTSSDVREVPQVKGNLLYVKLSNEPALLHGGIDEGGEKGMRLEGPGLEFGMKLYANEPNMVRNLYDFRKQAVRGEASEAEAGSLQLVAVLHVHFETMPMAFGNPGSAIDRRNPTILCKKGFIGTQPHRAAEIAAFSAQLQLVPLHPFRHQSDHRLGCRTEFSRTRFLDTH